MQALFNYSTPGEDCQADFVSRLEERKKLQEFNLPELVTACERLNKSQDYIKRITECGDYIKVTAEGDVKVLNLCKNRLCIVCAWKRSSKLFGETARMFKYLKAKFNYKFLFLTVTVRNVPAEELTKQINHLNSSYKRFYESKAFKRFSRGNIKNIEITYNQKKDTYHGHIHSIIAVDEDYFTNRDKYTNQEELRKLWERSARLSYHSQVDIRKIEANDEKAIAECCKYACKISNVYQIADKEQRVTVIKTLMQAIHNRRLHTLSKCFKEASAVVKNTDDEDDETEAHLKPTDKVLRWVSGFNRYVGR